VKKRGFSLEEANKWCNASKKDEPLRFVRMYDKNAIGEWRDKVFVFRSDAIVRAGKLEAVKIAMAGLWPNLEVIYDETLKRIGT
jgi:hypothetical protein